MNTVTIILASLTAFLLLCQLMCGSWLRRKGADESGKRFHARLGIANVIAGPITCVLAIITAA
jgi:hypothetical protein